MKKLILLLIFPLLGMPAFAQQKKKPALKKKQHTTTTAKKKKAVTKPPPESLPAGEPYDENAIDPGMPSYDVAPAPAPDNAGKVFTSVEEMPQFPGGMSALMHYLGDHIRYPAEAREDNVQGRVIVQFVVDKSGEIRNAVIMRDIGAGCGKEALRVVNSMPMWKPGKMHGQPVNVFFTLPVSFKLQDPDPDPVPTDTTK